MWNDLANDLDELDRLVANLNEQVSVDSPSPGHFIIETEIERGPCLSVRHKSARPHLLHVSKKCIAVRKVATPLRELTQCYLPPGRSDIPDLAPAEAGTRLSDDARLS